MLPSWTWGISRGLACKKNTLLFTYSINRYMLCLALFSITVLRSLGYQINSEPDKGILCFSKCCNGCFSETQTHNIHTYAHTTVHHTSRQHNSSFRLLLRLSITATQMSEKRVRQQAVTALAPGHLNHLPVSYQRLSSTSSTCPYSSCTHTASLCKPPVCFQCKTNVFKFPNWLWHWQLVLKISESEPAWLTAHCHS